MTRSQKDTSKAAPQQTKKAQLIGMLKQKGGKDITAISETFGWQQHTTRAALSGLRKAGFKIARLTPKSGGPARYRITAEPATHAAT